VLADGEGGCVCALEIGVSGDTTEYRRQGIQRESRLLEGWAHRLRGSRRLLGCDGMRHTTLLVSIAGRLERFGRRTKTRFFFKSKTGILNGCRSE
jgi:hypothetical protein